MAPWFERLPERLEHELQAFREAGLTAVVDEVRRKQGQLHLDVVCPIEGVDHTLYVVFPADYPYFPFQVFAPSLPLARHQDPYSKQLCFIAQIDSEWRTDDTVAHYLTKHLPVILQANRSEGSFDGERHEGAPVTLYLLFEHDSVVLIGDWVALPSEASSGTFQLDTEKEPGVGLLRGAVRTVYDRKEKKIAESDPRLSRSFKRTMTGRWVRLPSRPKSADRNSILADAAQVWPALATPHFQNDLDVLGITFPDEVRYREWQDTWIFLVRRRAGRARAPARGQRGALLVQLYLVRADRAGRTDLQARVPRLTSLSGRYAAVFGLGALGSSAAWQLARAGVGRLALIDHDFVNAGTIPRWIYGVSAVGRDKVSVAAERLAADYPFGQFDPLIARVGNPFVDPPTDAAMRRVLDEVDVIVDCTVERTVHHYLSSFAWQRGVPYVWASATPGGWGGIVGRIRPDRSRGCWKCFCGALLADAIPEPAREDEPDVQPVGCDAPTFRGAGFDLDEVAISCARLTVSTLTSGQDRGYGDFAWDVAVLNLWKDGHPIAPEWRTFELARRGECDAHG